MQNYQGLLNPSSFVNQQSAPQGGSYWMQYAQPPQYLNPRFAGTSQPPTTPGTGAPTVPNTPTQPTQPQQYANFRDSPAYKAGQPVRVGNKTYQSHGRLPSVIDGYNIHGAFPRALAQEVISQFAPKHDSFMTERMGQGANTSYYTNWLPSKYHTLAARMNMYEPRPGSYNSWNMVREAAGNWDRGDFLPASKRGVR